MQRKSLIMLSIAVALSGCIQTSMPEPDEGAAFFAANCASCHGNQGLGDGPLSADLPVQPVDLTVLSKNNGGVFPTARALSYIYGDPVDGHLARVMPQFGGQMADDLVPVTVDGVLTPTPRVLAALLSYLETIQR
jgi:mono/diheme cytochrome c family protein